MDAEGCKMGSGGEMIEMKNEPDVVTGDDAGGDELEETFGRHCCW